MTTTPDPTDDQLAAWLAGDLDAHEDRAVTAAVRTDPAVARRADALAAVMAQLASIADSPAPPPAPVEAILAAVTAAVGPTPSGAAAMPLALAAQGGVAGAGPGRTSVRPPDDPAFAGLADAPRGGRRPGRSTRPGGHPGRPRRDRALSAVAVVLLLAVLATVGIQSLRDGDPLVGEATSPTPATATEGDRPDTDRDQLGEGTEAGPATTEDDSPAASPDGLASPSPDAGSPGPVSDGQTGEDTEGAGQPGTTGPGGAPSGDQTTSGPGTGDPQDDAPPADGDGRQSVPPPVTRPTGPGGQGGGEGEADDSGGEDPAEGPGGGQGGGSDEPTEDAAPPGAPAGGDAGTTSPTVADSMVDLPDEQAARDHFSHRPEAQQLIGQSGDQARDTAARHAQEVRDSPPFASGVHPSNCLDVATAGSGTTVIAAVESATYAGRNALAHLVVTGEDTLTRAFVVVVDCTTCELLLRAEVPV